MRIAAYSKALYATWVYADTLRLLFDAGEGLNTHLEGRLLAFRDVALTHGHTDHFTGLHNVFITRLRYRQQAAASADEAATGPLRVLWPADDEELAGYLAYLRRALLDRNPGLAELVPVAPGDRVPLRGVRGVTLEPFAVNHRGGATCLGWRVLQERWKLRPELAGTPQSELNRMAAADGREAIGERVEVPLLVLSGDTRPLPPEVAAGAGLLLHEATFIGERLEESHSTLEEAVATWRAARAERLLVYHFSARYRAADIVRALDELVPEPEERARVWYVPPGEVFERDIRIAGL
jgi:ribonuclease Z